MKLDYSYANSYGSAHTHGNTSEKMFSALCTLVEVFITVYAGTRGSAGAEAGRVTVTPDTDLDQRVRLAADDPEAYLHA